MNITKKKTSGRRKIEMKRIEVKDSLQVTFSKRRTGLFKKASELCVLTGAKIAILVQSPGSRVFAFGYPDVDSVIETYLGNNVLVSENSTCMHGIDEYKKYLDISKELEVEKNKSNNVEDSDGFWWENSFENLEIDELEIYIKSMEELKNKVMDRADELRNSVTSSSFGTNRADDELRNSVTSSSFGTNRADELRNLVTSSLLNTDTNSSNVDRSLDDQVILPDLDQFLPVNVGVTNADLIMMQAYNYNSGGFNNYSFGNGELVLDNQDYVNHGGSDYQVSSDFGTTGVPNDNYFGQGQI